MSSATILAPVFAQVSLTFMLLLWLGALRVPAVRRGEVAMRDIALSDEKWPEQTRQASGAFSNQFELPVPVTFVILAWLFVATRIAHAAVYISSNDVPRRALIYSAGFAILGLMWLILFWLVVFG
jgi:hypothetical protein